MPFQKVGISVTKIAVLSLLILFQGVWVQGLGQTPPATTKGTLQVTVTPSDAKISVTGPEGVNTAIQNGEVKELKVGSYVVKAELEGYRTATQNVEVTAGETTKFDLSLVALSIAERGWRLLFWLTTIGVALFIAGYFIYLYLLQSKYYDLVLKTLGRVGEVNAVQTPAFPTAVGAVTKKLITVSGPKITPVGRESSEFTITHVDGAKVDVNNFPSADRALLSWTVDPTGNILVTPSGLTAKVIPATNGTFKLNVTAKNATGTDYVGEFDFVATTESQTKLDIPWVGAGYGATIIAVIILGIATILGFTGILTGEAVATILGTLAGYIFGVRRES